MNPESLDPNDQLKIEAWIERVNRRVEDGVKEIYITKGKMDAFLEFGEKQIAGIAKSLDALTQQIAEQREALTNITRLIFGDSRTQKSPNIRSDLDRHEIELIEVRENIDKLTELNKGILVSIEKLSDNVSALEAEMRPFLYASKLMQYIPRLIWDKSKEVIGNRWVRALVPIVSFLIALLIEYLKSIGVL